MGWVSRLSGLFCFLKIVGKVVTGKLVHMNWGILRAEANANTGRMSRIGDEDQTGDELMRCLNMLEQTEGGFAVQVPDLAVCTFVKDIEAAKRAAAEGIRINLRLTAKLDGKYPKGHTFRTTLEIRNLRIYCTFSISSSSGTMETHVTLWSGVPLIPNGLINAYFKTERARKRIEELRLAILHYVKGEHIQCRVSVEERSQWLKRRLRVEIDEPHVWMFLIAGDVFSCLRATLDHAVWLEGACCAALQKGSLTSVQRAYFS